MLQELYQLLYSIDPALYIIILAMLPLFEARYAVIVAYILHKKFGTLPWYNALFLSMIGNIIVVIPILYLLPWIEKVMGKWYWSQKLLNFFLNRARKRKDLIDKHGFWGLTIFVAVPLPVTGAWTGTLMAYLFNISKKKAILALVVGVFIATSFMTLASYGGIEFLSVILPKVSL
ncbi:MAG: small multi-drug export protein [bacterium]|nr:small multi-drug export protein [bacterium]MBU1918559.1 small multi-drug export protein [bacterium]